MEKAKVKIKESKNEGSEIRSSLTSPPTYIRYRQMQLDIPTYLKTWHHMWMPPYWMHIVTQYLDKHIQDKLSLSIYTSVTYEHSLSFARYWIMIRSPEMSQKSPVFNTIFGKRCLFPFTYKPYQRNNLFVNYASMTYGEPGFWNF